MDDTQFKTCSDVVDAKKPLGDWASKPAVPASTVAAVNNSGWDMLVEVTGGTVTVVAVDNVTIGTRVAGVFRVRNGSSIKLTYSVAPTWQWFYE